MGRSLKLLLLALPLAGCAGGDAPSQSVTLSSSVAANWRVVATPDDRRRLGQWRTAFTEALAQALAKGHAADVTREGALLHPDSALANARIPAGDYRCRVIKLGAAQPGLGSFTRYPAFDCRISDEGEVASFAKISGSQRPVGLIFDSDAQRQVFLGTMMLGDESRAIDYGRDADRDMVGAIERIGPARWRLILPYPRFESIMDVIELVPASAV